MHPPFDDVETLRRIFRQNRTITVRSIGDHTTEISTIPQGLDGEITTFTYSRKDGYFMSVHYANGADGHYYSPPFKQLEITSVAPPRKIPGQLSLRLRRRYTPKKV